ncbi:MAG: hypothetical protein HKN01_05440, partial [Acidimicrobiia bacterium]|nr:hypothetical protein [Acidimicrobiia bacterium]
MILFLLAVTGASGVWLIASRVPKMTLEKRVAGFLVSSRAGEADSIAYPPLLDAGLAWSRAELRVRRAIAVVAGIASGALLAQGDLFLAGPTRSTPVLMVLGGAAGALLFSMWLTSRRQHRER